MRIEIFPYIMIDRLQAIADNMAVLLDSKDHIPFEISEKLITAESLAKAMIKYIEAETRERELEYAEMEADLDMFRLKELS